MTKRNWLWKLFPIPRYLRMPAIGFDLSDRSVKIVELKNFSRGIKLNWYAERLIPPGIIEAGRIKNESGLKKILSSLKNEFHLNYVNVSLPDEQSYTLRLRSPVGRQSDIHDNLEIQLGEHVPVPVTDLVFDYEVIDRAGGAKPFFDVQVSALPRSMVEEHTRLFLESGLTPMAFEIEAQALSRSVIQRADDSTYMTIDFGKTRTGFSIFSGGVVWFSSTINVGGDQLVGTIAKELNVGEDEARLLKEKKGLLKQDDDRIFNAIIPIISILKDEIHKHYNYWQTHRDESGITRQQIKKIIMCGGDANVPGLLEYLSYDLRVPIRLANPWVNLASFDDYIPPVSFNHSLRYAVALGLGLRNLKI